MSFPTPLSDANKQGEDRRPCLLVCNWSASEPVWDLVEDLSGNAWEPEGIRTVLVDPNDDVLAQADYLANMLVTNEARALLLIGRTRHETGPARLQLRTEIPLQNGQRPAGERPGVARTTAPAGQIIEAVAKSRISIIASSENEADEGSHLLYEVLTRLDDRMDTPAVAMIRFPASMPEMVTAQTVKAAATVMTQHLTPLPRFAAAR